MSNTDWRLLAYMAGDNNLSADMAWALQSMKEYLDNPANTGKNEVEVIAQYDPNGLKPRVLEMSKPERAGRVVLEEAVSGTNDGEKPGEEDGNLDEAVTEKITLKDMFKAVSDDLKRTGTQQPSPHAAPVTQDFVACRFADLSTEAMLRTFMTKHLDGDSRKHMLVLSGHGAGVSGDFLTDEDPHSSLMISRLGQILTDACSKKKSSEEKKTRIDILGLDSCLMGMAEVACEVKDHVSFLVGSEGFVNNTGWPYHRVLNVLADAQDAGIAAEGIVEKYAAFYQDYEMSGSSTQIAALRLSKLETLTAAVKTLVGALAPKLESNDVRNAVILAHWYAQSFKWGEYADLWDFCDQLMRFLPNGEFEEKIKRVKTAIDGKEGEEGKEGKNGKNGVVIRSCYCGPEFQHAHGIAIYFPWSALAVPPSYKELKFAQETGWDKFLDVYLKTTRRMRRGDTRRQLGDKPQDPRRFGPDVNEGENLTTLRAFALSDVHGSKSGSHYGTRSGSPYGTRSGSPYGTKSGSHYGTRMLGGTLIVPANFQNVPDGYLRQDLGDPERFTGDEQKPGMDKSDIALGAST
jgi:Clostripain family